MADYYNPLDKVVYDGDTARAADLNSINTAVDSAFEQVDTDIQTLDTKVDAVSSNSEKWAIDPQGTNPDPLQPTKYSSLANAEEAEAWASGTGGVSTEADGVTTITRSAKEYAEDAGIAESNANISALSATSSANTAITNAGLTALDLLGTNADVVTTGNNVAAAQLAQTGAETAQGLAEDAQAAAEAVTLVTVEKTSDTGQAKIPAGTTAQRDTPSEGDFRFNTETPGFEGYVSGEWGAIAGGGGGGLDWSSPAQSVDFTGEDGKGYPVDTSGGVVTTQLPVGTAGMTVAVKDYAQTFDDFPCLLVPNGTENIEGVNDSLKVDTRGAYVTLVYTDATKGWLAVSASAQNPVVTKPFMQVQEHQPVLTNLASTAGANDRTLNTVVSNNIPGASLVSGEVLLPAGTYYIEALGAIGSGVGNKGELVLADTDDNILIRGMSSYAGNYVCQAGGTNGSFTLTQSTTVKLTQYISITDSTGMGIGASDLGLGSDIYADLRIWKLDSDIQVPRVYQPVNQPVVGAEVTGGIFGGELVYSGTTDVDVNPISCMDDTLTQEIAVTGVTNVVLSAPTINTVYNFFAVRYNTDTYGIEYDTDVNGANLPGTVTHKRWIGFVRTNSLAEVCDFLQDGDFLIFTKVSENVVISSFAATTAIDISSHCPQSRVSSYDCRGIGSRISVKTANDYVLGTFNGGSGADTSELVWGTSGCVVPNTEQYYTFALATASLTIRSYTLKR